DHARFSQRLIDLVLEFGGMGFRFFFRGLSSLASRSRKESQCIPSEGRHRAGEQSDQNCRNRVKNSRRRKIKVESKSEQKGNQRETHHGRSKSMYIFGIAARSDD